MSASRISIVSSLRLTGLLIETGEERLVRAGPGGMM
jgi:hypothetical protein